MFTCLSNELLSYFITILFLSCQFAIRRYFIKYADCRGNIHYERDVTVLDIAIFTSSEWRCSLTK